MDIIRPGKYIQGVSGAMHSIKGATTSKTAFIGITAKGPLDQALPVSSFTDFQNKYGNFLPDNYLAYAAYQFFENGGQQLYIARVKPIEDGALQESAYEKAFSLLDPIHDISLIAVPGIGSLTLFGFASAYCKNRRDCFFIGDTDSKTDTQKDVESFINNLRHKSSFGAVYFPWLKINDPAGLSSGPIAVPPSGSVAGIFSRMDAQSGVWKAAAGMGSEIMNAIGLTATIHDQGQSSLNSIGVNTIRDFPGRGIFIWGARTLATQSDPEYRYVAVRRTSIFIEQSILKSTEWVVFEPNNETLWEEIRTLISSFMMDLFRKGAFQGNKPDEAFFVKCGRNTTSQNEIDQGTFNILLGFAPLRPAEFLLLRITLHAGESRPTPSRRSRKWRR